MSDITEANKEFIEKFADAMLKKQPEIASDKYRVKRVLWCSEPEWKTKSAIDYYADTLTLLCDGDDNHCLELRVSGTVSRLNITNPWKYV